MQKSNEYTTAELAAMLKLSENAFRNRVYRGTFPRPTRKEAQYTFWRKEIVAPFLPASST